MWEKDDNFHDWTSDYRSHSEWQEADCKDSIAWSNDIPNGYTIEQGLNAYIGNTDCDVLWAVWLLRFKRDDYSDWINKRLADKIATDPYKAAKVLKFDVSGNILGDYREYLLQQLPD